MHNKSFHIKKVVSYQSYFVSLPASLTVFRLLKQRPPNNGPWCIRVQDKSAAKPGEFAWINPRTRSALVQTCLLEHLMVAVSKYTGNNKISYHKTLLTSDKFSFSCCRHYRSNKCYLHKVVSRAEIT